MLDILRSGYDKVRAIIRIWFATPYYDFTFVVLPAISVSYCTSTVSPIISSSLLPALPLHSAPLLQHMREQDINTRHINRQYRPQRISILHPQLTRRRNRTINQPALARHPKRIQHHESVIPNH